MVQSGPRPRLSVVDVPGKGRGLVTETQLETGVFVCEYAGEVIGESVSHAASHWSKQPLIDQ